MQSNTAHICSRDKLRSEISSQIRDYLRNGGRIEVLGMQTETLIYSQHCHKPAAIDEFGLHSASIE